MSHDDCESGEYCSGSVTGVCDDMSSCCSSRDLFTGEALTSIDGECPPSCDGKCTSCCFTRMMIEKLKHFENSKHFESS